MKLKELLLESTYKAISETFKTTSYGEFTIIGNTGGDLVIEWKNDEILKSAISIAKKLKLTPVGHKNGKDVLVISNSPVDEALKSKIEKLKLKVNYDSEGYADIFVGESAQLSFANAVKSKIKNGYSPEVIATTGNVKLSLDKFESTDEDLVKLKKLLGL